MKGDKRKERKSKEIKIKEAIAEAKSVQYDQQEAEAIAKKKMDFVGGRQRDFITLQNDYRKSFLIVQLKDVVLSDLKEKLDGYKEDHNMSNIHHGTDNKFNDRMTVEWDGNWKTYRRLVAEYNLDVFQYNQDMQTMIKMRKDLDKFNVTDEEVQGILNGKYIKEDRKPNE